MEATRRPSPSGALDERYGASGRPPRVVLLLAGAIGLLALAWLGWVVWSASNPDVHSSLRAYEVIDPHTVRAEVLVHTRSADVRASCRLRAFGVDHDVVGERTFEVHGVDGTTRRALRFRTERKATSVELVGCTTGDQSRPR